MVINGINPALTSTGLGSGLDISGMVEKLVAVKINYELTPLQNKAQASTSEISVMGQVKSLLSDLETASKTLKNLQIRDSYSSSVTDATSSLGTKFTVTTGSVAATGTYNIEVLDLAQAEKRLSNKQMSSTTSAITDGSSTPIAGVLRFTVGSSYFDVTVDSTNNTLDKLKDAINNASGNLGVQASISTTTDSGGVTSYKLMLNSTNTGTANSFTVAEVGGGNVASTLDITTELTEAKNAKIRINSSIISESATNTITNAIEGITFNVKLKTTTDPVVLTVSKSTTSLSALKDSISGFVSKYNTTISALQAMKADGAINSATVNTLLTKLSSMVSSRINSSDSLLNSLASLGVETNDFTQKKTQKNNEYKEFGILSFDAEAYDKISSSKINEVVNILANSTAGIGKKFTDATSSWLDSQNGLVSSRVAGLNAMLKETNKRIANVSDQIGVYQENTLAQFNRMDLLVGKLRSSGDSLIQSLNAMTNNNNKK